MSAIVSSLIIPPHTVSGITPVILSAIVSDCKNCNAPMGPVRVFEGSKPNNRHQRGKVVQTVSRYIYIPVPYRIKAKLLHSVAVGSRVAPGLHFLPIQPTFTRMRQSLPSKFSHSVRGVLLNFFQGTTLSVLLSMHPLYHLMTL